MESILQKIVNAVRQREGTNFEGFYFDKTIGDRKPIDILPIIKREFFHIFEIKKASPSKGIIRDKFDHLSILNEYEKSGASAISVITEPEFFLGSKQYLSDVKNNTSLPVLRKDFVIHPFQIYESYCLGADFLLLIVACLSVGDLRLLNDLALHLGMNTLIEVHNEEEVEKVLKINPKIIGINNRDLKSFNVDIGTSFRLKKMIPDDVLVISESGIKSNADILKLKQNGFSGVLVGESLLKEDNISEAAKRLVHG